MYDVATPLPSQNFFSWRVLFAPVGSSVPIALWHRFMICSVLLLRFGGAFCSSFVVLSPSWTPDLVCFWGRAFLALGLPLIFALVPFVLWLLCVVLLCWWFCLRFAVVFSLAFSLPPSVGPLWRPGPVLCWSLPLGIWLLYVTARLPCFIAWCVVVQCFPCFILFHGSKGLWPCEGFCVTLCTMVHV